MFKNALLGFVLLSYALLLTGSPKVIFRDDFTGNKNKWVLKETSQIRSEIKNGSYTIENITGSGFNTYTNQLDTLNYFADFSFETNLRQEAGVENFPYGLVFGMKDVHNFYAFGITSSGYYVVYYYFNGRQKKLAEWAKSEVIRPLGENNKLKVSREDGMLNCYVNDRLVHSMNARALFGKLFGYVLNNRMQVSVDDIVVTSTFENHKKLGSNYLIANGVVKFDEPFDDNRNRWIEDDTELASSLITGGQYKIRHKVNSLYYVWSQYKFFSEFDDFLLETEMKQIGGDANKGYGLVFGMKDTENYFAFDVSSSGYFRVFGYENGHFFDMIPWKKSKWVYALGNMNKLILRKKGDLLYFYINQKEVGVAEYRKFFGHRVGFQVSRQMYCAVNDLVISVPKKEIQLIENPFQGLVKENMGTPINSEYEELGPIISSDGNTLYFLRDEHPGNVSNELKIFEENEYGLVYDSARFRKKIVYYNDIWVSQKQKDGAWSKARNIGEPLNNPGHNFVISVSPDNNTLLLANEYQKDGSPGGDGISLTQRTKFGWSIPQPLDIVGDYNRNKYVSYFLSGDNKTLMMALEQEDTHGDLDFYVSFRKDDGNWTSPKNMGPDINSAGSESTMFLAADNRTLYFSSNGFPGYGSNDIFVSKRLDDTWTRWSPPKNLGPEVNTKEWDGYYSLAASGDYAYLASYTNTIGMSDLFRIPVHENARPEPVILVKGKVLDRKTKKPLATEISVRNLKDDKEVAIAHSNPVDGAYEIILPRGKSYGFYAEKEGYYALRRNADLTQLKTYQEKEVDLPLIPLNVGETVVLNNVFFKRSKADLLGSSYAELNHIVDVLKENPTMKVEIHGHTDNTGNAKLNEELSKERAEKVVDYLASKGISRTRLFGKGFGGSKPIADNRKEETRKLNRRVEMKVVSR